MKYLTVKTLLATAVMGLSGSALATTVYLNQDGLRAGSGTYYNLIYDGSDLFGASTATWDWTGGVLTQTGGVLLANQRIGSAPGPESSRIISDQVTGLVIDTNVGTTTAALYDCFEGGFGAGTGASSCGNYAWGFNATDESLLTYNVAGADCADRTIGGDDSIGTSGGGAFRGLRARAAAGPCGNNGVNGTSSARGALDMINIVYQSGGMLILGNANGGVGGLGGVAGSCYLAGAGDPGCLRAHWLVFTDTVPVPAAAWLFGSALGLLGWVRRRAMA